MQFLKAFLRNLVFLFVLGIVLLILFPTQMSQIYQLYGALFGPIALLMLLVAALPRKRRRY